LRGISFKRIGNSDRIRGAIMGTLDTLTNGVLTKTAVYASTTAGDQASSVITGIPGKKIRIFAIAATTNIGGTNFYLRNGLGGTAVTETYYRAISGSPSAAYYSRVGYQGIWLYETLAGVALVLNCTTAGAQVSVSLTYSYI
jgi:hypothetical protein